MKLLFQNKREGKTANMTAKRYAELKGANFTLSVLKLFENEPDAVHNLLASKREQAPNFFENAPLVLNLELFSELPNLTLFKQIIREQGFMLIGVTGVQKHMRQAIHQLGLPVLSSLNKDVVLREEQTHTQSTFYHTHVHTGHVRSGQQVYAENSSLVILGMVGPGAEVIADDSIHVYGALRGRAIAGVKANASGIFCSRLEPELISIAGIYQISDKIPKQYWRQSAHIKLSDDKITFQPIHS